MFISVSSFVIRTGLETALDNWHGVENTTELPLDTATVRVLRFDACSALEVVIPVGSVIVHCVNGGKIADAVVNIIDAVAEPEFEALAVNEEVSQSQTTGTPRLPIVNDGRLTTIVSVTPKGMLTENEKLIEVGACVIGFWIFKMLCTNLGVEVTLREFPISG